MPPARAAMSPLSKPPRRGDAGTPEVDHVADRAGGQPEHWRTAYPAEMPQDRRHRPAGVERLLRQQACFGCAICGHPIFVYHHITPYTEKDPHYRPEDMMVVCPNHHDPITRGVMSEGEQREHKANPYNCSKGYASGMLTAANQARAELDVGKSVRLIGAGILIAVDGECLLGLSVDSNTAIEISARLYDRDDQLLAEIDRDEWIAESPFPWDIDFDYRFLAIRSEPRQIRLELDARKTPMRLRGELWRRGRQVLLGDDGIRWTGGGGISEMSIDGFTIDISSSKDEVHAGKLRPIPVSPKIKLERNLPCWCGSGKKFKRCHGFYI